MRTDASILNYLPFVASSEQKTALLSMSEFVSEINNEDFFILSGAAGTGKTSITTALIQYLIAAGIEYNVVAPTGRAARILGRKAKTSSKTIHSLIYNTNNDPKTGEILFSLKSNKISDPMVLIIDEASMVPSINSSNKNSLFKSKNALLDDLVRFVKNGNKESKLIFLGDDSQLPPINENFSKALSLNYLRSRFNMKGRFLELTEVKRQDKQSAILKNANLLRVDIKSGIENYKLSGIPKKSLYQAALDYIIDFSNYGFEEVVSIGATHKMNAVFNRAVRENVFGSKPNIVESNELLMVTQTVKKNDTQFYSGDHIIVSELFNNKIVEIANLHFMPVKIKIKTISEKEEIISDYVILESINNPTGLTSEQENRLRHERIKSNKVFRESGNPGDDKYVGAIRASYGYSITCNKAQGGEWNKVFLNSFYYPSLRYQYTAITRAQKNLVLY